MAMPLRVPEYTIDMLATFPDDGCRYELLEGMLLVTPQASNAHQLIATQIAYLLRKALAPRGLARVVAPGAIQKGKRTELQPDVLVYPAAFSGRAEWADIRGWWLAVEVISRASRIYDRDFKRPAYLALGVAEYWLVDPRERCVDIWTASSAVPHNVTDRIVWSPSALDQAVTLDIEEVFQDLDPVPFE